MIVVELRPIFGIFSRIRSEGFYCICLISYVANVHKIKRSQEIQMRTWREFPSSVKAAKRGALTQMTSNVIARTARIGMDWNLRLEF